MPEAGSEVNALGAALAGDERQLERLEAALAAYVVDDKAQGGRPYTLALVALVDHESPEPDLRFGWRRRQKAVVGEHHEPDGRLIEVDGSVPGRSGEQRLGQRDRVG